MPKVSYGWTPSFHFQPSSICCNQKHTPTTLNKQGIEQALYELKNGKMRYRGVLVRDQGSEPECTAIPQCNTLRCCSSHELVITQLEQFMRSLCLHIFPIHVNSSINLLGRPGQFNLPYHKTLTSINILFKFIRFIITKLNAVEKDDAKAS